MKKSDVNGPNELPLYKFLKSQKAFKGFGDSEMGKKLKEMFDKLLKHEEYEIIGEIQNEKTKKKK